MIYTNLDTLFGKIFLLAQDNKLTGLYFENQKNIEIINKHYKLEPESHVFLKVQKQLEEYFKGKRYFFDIEYAFNKGTIFQQKVWQAVSKIGYGRIISYSQIAQSINLPKSIRAVATAIGQNPIAIIIPCHRIISKNGDLAGYAAGLEVKRDLLLLEKKAGYNL